MNSVRYVTVDVFTRTRFAGNQLAVIPDASGLSDGQMQSIAAEFNYSEATFVLSPDDTASQARVRIFTPTVEIPFAGHPNVGTAFVLGRQGELFGRPVPDAMQFEELVIVLGRPISTPARRQGAHRASKPSHGRVRTLRRSRWRTGVILTTTTISRFFSFTVRPSVEVMSGTLRI